MLERGDEDPARLVGMFEGEPTRVAGLLELLQLRFPGELVGVCFSVEGGVTVVRIGGAGQEQEAIWLVSGALRAVLALQRPHVFGPAGSPIFAVPQGRAAAMAVRRSAGGLSAEDRRYIELLALHVR
jgi:hypothetical protein